MLVPTSTMLTNVFGFASRPFASIARRLPRAASPLIRNLLQETNAISPPEKKAVPATQTAMARM
jgi:hypothetical protein